ncbi:hypothetical protein OA07_11900 [Aphanizomenon flos-aquae 2012/KM1/D3]|uniref:Ig-like domain-containing protein n=1 Tax=Aphanizomenon flos-aquae TaxID=1176 RepID=UPI0005429776|nr:Ig-like domain-containing protein [Aphanizomenon flos-aquae]KHG41357.1 hypothetical protein OA07_11900 [Aphanizomenon flos-aquae 2012/KM1/D3]
MAHQIVDNLASGQEIPNIQIIPQSQLKADGAFGNNTIYISQDLVNSQQSNFSQVVNVLLEEMGHYIDSQINIQDAPGDEGAIFAKLVQNQPLAPGELITLKAEDDHGILNINGQNIAVEHADTPGVFLVDNTGRISIDFLADSGSYHNEMAIFSLENMDSLTPGSADYIKEAARRALSNSTLGYTVIIDINEGAKFVGEIGESNKNDGNYSGLKTFSFTPGDKVAFMLVPEGTVQKVFDNPNPGSSQRPLFSIAAANPNNATQIGQLVPGTFGWEDIRNDQSTDADYNDIIFKIQGANGTLTDIGGLFASGKDWRNVPLAQEIITFASQSNNTTLIAKLSQDTGISNLDIITNNPEISGSINNADNISKLQAKFTDGSNFVDILSELKANGSFVLNKEKLAQIKGGQIADGDYQLNLRAEDKFGNISEFLVKFTLDTTKPGIPTEVGLKNDGDRVTNQNTPTITGNGENGALIELFDGQNKLGQTTVVNGFWEITTSQITDGLKKLTITATDISGNPSDASNTEFTIDSALPQINITNPQTNAILNPGARLQGTVNGTGSTIDKLSYRFGNNSEINVPINNQGAFDVELNLTGLSGQQNLIIKAVDLAVNSKETTQNVVVNQSTPDTTAPSITASLNNDTGINTDGITFDSTITGTVTDISEITTFQAKLNSGNFVDVLAKLQNGNFTLDTATLTQINGGQLPDGVYKLNFKAEDKFGNVSSEVKLDFTLDTTAPQTPGFMLDSLVDSAPIGDSQTTYDKVKLIGQTEANATVTLQQTGISITADTVGKFTFTDVPLILGDNSLTVNAKDAAGNTSTFTTIIKRVNQDNSDVVLDWNATLLNAIYEDKTTPPVASRNMAITQTAVFDAINSITGTYKNYHFTGTAPTIVSAEAAAVSAAHQVLINLYPGQKSYFDNSLTASLAEITDGTAEDNGVTFGRTVADAILTFRSADGSSNTITYTPGTNPGEWQPTSPGFASALLPQWGQVTPFALTSGDQFRPDGTPALNSAEYTTEFNQVKDLGSKNSTNRTAEQSQIAKFWADGSGTFTPPGHWNQIAQNVAATKGNSLVDNARVFALLNISLADAGIAAWDAKYTYNFWRPITAIQNADSDGNANTIADANWTPLLTTPPFPEYISGHSTFSGAAETILTGLLGNNVSFTTNSLGTPGIYRTFSNFTNAANEAGISRIYGGIHFNSANVEGLTTGRSVGNYVLQNLLLPIIDNQSPVIQVNLLNDTGSSNSDKISANSTIQGTVTDTSEITKLEAKLNSGNFVNILAKLENGNFTLDQDTLTAINGGQLADGTYQLTLKAEDKFANVSPEVNLAFTLDTTKPAAATELKIKDDTDTVTKDNTPIISGQAETATKVQIFDGQTKLGETTSENGVWEITTSQLTDGVKNLTVITTDIAGNVSDNASLSITVDTVVPDFNITTPQANGELTTGARLQGTVNGTGSTITQLTYRFNNGSEINVPVNGQGAFDVELNLTSLSGQQNLILSSLDLAGNSTQTTINVTINSSVPDTTPPTVIISSTPSTATSFVELTFNEPVQDSSFTADKYSLKVSGGTNDGQTVVISSVEKLSATLVRLNLAAAFTTGNYKLTVASGITDIPGNATTTAQNFDLNIAAAPLEISPTNGEEMVGLNRETVVRFGKKIDPTTVKDDSFYLIANGQRIAGEIKVSSTEEFATFFYANPLPASTEVRVVVDGSKIIGRDGVAIDGNLDGLAGGIATADFTTLPITRIQGTDVWGYVYDSYNKNPDGSNIPIKGVTIRLDALPDVFAVTDDKGYFILKDVPAPDFYVYIDGSTATGAPAATQYASLGKPFHSVPGQSTQLFMDGLPFNVYLPPMAASDVKALSTTEATQVGFGEASQAFLEELFPNVDPDVWTQVQVTFNPGSAQDDGGNAATQAMIIPVDPQRLPAPLPPGVNPQLVISIQAGGANGFNREADGGATNFDVPAPIQFPNLEGLQPGEKSLFWSFDHDAGKWIVIGTGTVSEDGKTIKSDPGVGVLAPGWHFTQPGSPTNGPKKPDDDCDPNFFTLTNAIDLFELVAKCAAGFTGLGAIVSKIFKLYSEVKSLINNTNSLFKQIEEGGVDAGTIRATFKTINSVKKTVVATFSEIKKQNPLGKALAISKCLEGLLGYAASVCDRIRKEDSDCDTITVRTVCRGLDLAKATLGKTNGLIEKINKGLDDQLLALACGTLDQIAALVGFAEINENRVAFSTESNLFLAAVGDENDGTIDIDLVKTELQTLLKQMEQFQTDVATAEDFLNIVEDTTNQVENLEDDANNMYASTVGYTSNSFYLIEYGDFQLRGKTDSNGQFDAVLPPSTDFSLSIYDSVTNRIATYNGQTSASGIASSIPAVRFVTTEGIAQTFERIGEKLTSDITDALSDIEINGLPDTDGDGLVNAAERIIGTVLTKIDTDNDGINDLVEIQQGLDPLGGQAFPTGIISSLPLQGEANAVTVAGSITNSQTQTAYVATGSYGLAVVNASQFNNPVILGQLDLPGNATDVAVDTRLNIAAVASNSGGLHLVNVADGMLPSLNKTIDIDANQVEIADGIAYATVNNVLYAIDLATGEQLQSLNLPGSGTVTGLARERTTLYAFVSGSDTFSSIDITDEGAATVLGQLNVNVASSDVGLSVSNGIAYLAGSGLRTINVSNPSSPTLISDADNFFTARGVTLNGSGLALVSAEDQGLAVYSITDPQNTNAFLTVFNTPGFAYNAAIASGIAFLADGSSGLQVINYLSFDNKGQAPTININTSAIDLDPNTAGIQVQEGTTIPILADILDDVQVRNVELLVNGTVISNDVSFPWDLSVIAPAITPDKNTVDIQVRATDTGGNTVLSNTLTLNLKEDIFAPTVLGTTPSEGARRKEIPSIAIRFNEALDTTKLNLSGITLTNLGADGVLGGGDDTVATLTDLQTRNFDRTLVILTGGELPLGEYQLKVDPSIISDLSGNALANSVTLNFTKRPLTRSLDFGNTITGSIVEAGEDEVYTFNGTAGQRLYYDGLINNNTSTIYSQLISPSGQTVFSNGDADSDRGPFTLTETGTYKLIIDGYSDNTGDYSFRLIDASAATTITLDTTITDTLTPGLETDIYRINGTAGQRLFFDSLVNSTNATWRLYNPGNGYVTSANYGDFETTLNNDGTYLLVLSGYNNDNTNYSFKVTNPPTTTTTLTLGNTVTSTISQPGEIKEYTFNGTAGQRLYYDGLINNNTSTIYSQLISPSGQTVFSLSDADSDRGPFTLTETGTYKLIIDGYLDNTGDYSFRLLDASAATTITLDTTITDTLTPGLETDIYRINGTAGQRLFFDSLVNFTNATWRLYNPGNGYVTSANYGDFETTLNNDGTYLLVLSGYNNDNTNYSFKVTNPPTTTTTLTLGNTVTSTISQPGEIKEYTFNGTAGQRLYYDGLINNNTSTIYSQLISPSGQTVFSLSDADSDRSPFTLTETGTYKLIIDGYLDNTGDYSFRLIDASAATNLALNTQVAGTLDPGLETAIYRITGTAGQKLRFDSLNSGFVNGYWTLYKPGNQYVTSYYLGSDFEVDLPGDGTYLLVVGGYTANETVNYKFQITEV